MSRELLAELRREGLDDVDDSTLTRALYSSDASLYRVVPQAVVRPRHRDDLGAVLTVARRLEVPVTMRGAGTSIAGNAVGPGIVVDCARHLHRILALDPEARTAVVEPGVVHASLQQRATAEGLRFGPDPSTHPRCTIGGMVGNNACGSRALGYGRTADNVAALTVLWGTVERAVLPGGPAAPKAPGSVAAGLTDLVAGHLEQVRTRHGRFTRQVSGYALEQLLPEHGARVDRFLVGSEGTLGLVLDATVTLVADAPHRLLVVLGYPSMVEAADAVPALLAHSPVACEGLDSRITDVVRSHGHRVPELPPGEGWLFLEVTGDTAAECRATAAQLVVDGGALGHRYVEDPDEAAALWRIREDGAGLAARSLARPGHPGWEDAAVPPEHLGAWLRDFAALLDEFGLDAVPYGHFGDGCVHARIDFTFDDAPARQRFREFLVAGATALRRYSGSLSGEHGDGRARSELLPLMYDNASLRLFAAAKHHCDPDGILNPGVLVDPAPLDADLRPGRPRHEPALALRLAQDGGSLAEAVHRCTGVGKCVSPTTTGVMCPSYLATREEKDSTRGRARVLQEALDGELVQGLRDPAVHQALDLCLACKGCLSDCPTGVDMATYKAEVLQQQYARRPRPRSHYALGRLPRWLALPGGRAAASVLGRPPLAALAKAVAGIDRRRTLPVPARVSWRTSYGRGTRLHGTHDVPSVSEPPDVWIWADTFTDHFRPEAGRAAIEVLRGAGLEARVIPERGCCGLTWITTGQLDAARRILGGTVAMLTEYVETGAPILGLEPSCLAVLRSDAAELLDDPRVERLAGAAVTLAELLERRDWEPPDLSDLHVVAQPHCHHAAVLGWAADERLLQRAGATVTRVPGCCGLAGTFGLERGHYEVSVAVAETHLLPAVRAHPDAVVLADGLSCRTQLADLAGIDAVPLAELLAARMRR